MPYRRPADPATLIVLASIGALLAGAAGAGSTTSFKITRTVPGQ